MVYLDSSFFTGGGDPLAVWAELEAVDLLAVALVGEDAALNELTQLYNYPMVN